MRNELYQLMNHGPNVAAAVGGLVALVMMFVRIPKPKYWRQRKR